MGAFVYPFAAYFMSAAIWIIKKRWDILGKEQHDMELSVAQRRLELSILPVFAILIILGIMKLGIILGPLVLLLVGLFAIPKTDAWLRKRFWHATPMLNIIALALTGLCVF